ncbi:DUF6508 domain-containing protein [Neobacillus niacini]|uniref:DUF6508 domain-containing protein n=1 Tax=Neobacillus niacini TaxID=86668 RepID=UPI00203AFE96|nr:DUF6508 domain-containing protein [Neobacillus niacini]MCM3694594.1 DUF6508 domain-containing protein [Neobacillus niacini]
MHTYIQLLSYIPYFEDKNIEFCVWEGMYPKYDEKLEEFIKEVYKTDLMKSNYLDYLDEKRINRDYAAVVPTADFELLRAILTYYVRSERFSDGAWANSAKEGVFLRILNRLKELDGYGKMDDGKITEALKKVKPGLEKYLKIMNLVKSVDVSKDKEFQRAFNGFYRVRQRPQVFYDTFYSFMEVHKESAPSFEKTLRYIHKELGRIEPSFSSKLVATINPNLPIWDSVVLNNLQLKPPAYYRKDRIEESIRLYERIVDWYKDYLKDEEGQKIIELFDEAYPNTGITDIKKVDFVIWQIRG